MSSSLPTCTPSTNTTNQHKHVAMVQRPPKPTITNASNNATSTKRKILSSLVSGGGKKNLPNGLSYGNIIDARDTTNTDYKGVYPNGLKFNAQVHMHGKLHYLGTFKTAKIAALVYDCAVLKHKLPLSKLNFPFQLPALPGASSKGNEETDADNNAHQVVQHAPKQPKPGMAVYKGVSPNGNQFNAQITVDGEMKYFDTFRTAKIAALAYDCAVLRHKLPLSMLNFPFEIPELPTNDGRHATRGVPTNPRKKRKLASPTSAASVGHRDEGENSGVVPAQGTFASTCRAFSIGTSNLSDGFDEDEDGDGDEEEALPLVYWA